MIYKNTYGVTIEIKGNLCEYKKQNPFAGSSLNRKKNDTRKFSKQAKNIVQKELMEAVIEKGETEIVNVKTMSARTKSKIRRKVIAFSQLFKRLSFVTLTFVNKIEDEHAVIILRKFLDNTKKRSKDFQYLWVAEKQSKNMIFKDNIHFHLITNKYWDLNKDWKYWLDLQNKNGIIPRDESFKPSSSFDVRGIVSNNIKGVTYYLTKYVTKNESKLKCQIWNCSKKVSALYTGFYSDQDFLDCVKSIEGATVKKIALDYCNLHLINLNRDTLPLYHRIQEKNKNIWAK